MRKQEVQKVFKQNDISLTELKKVYNGVIKQAKIIWRDSCIQEDIGYGLSSLIAQIGFNSNYGLMGRAYCDYSYIKGEAEEWYYALQVSLLDDKDYTAVDAADWLYEDKYYQKTGQISQISLQECSKVYGLHFKSFEDVAVELAEKLQNR